MEPEKPQEEYIPSLPAPIITYFLILVMVVLFFRSWPFSSSMTWQDLWTSTSNISLSSLQKWGIAKLAIEQGEYWRFFTAIFFHSTLLHLLFNVMALYSLGGVVESIFGKRDYLLLFLLAGIGSSMSSYFFELNMVTLGSGASGAICGLLGALLMVLIKYKEAFVEEKRTLLVRQLLFWLFFCLIVGISSSSIGNIAHTTGFVLGGIFGYLFPPRNLIQTTAPWKSFLSILLFTGIFLLIGLAFYQIHKKGLVGSREAYKADPLFPQESLKTYPTPYFSISLPSWIHPKVVPKKDWTQYLILNQGAIIEFRVFSPLKSDMDVVIDQYFQAREKEAREGGKRFFKIPREDRFFSTQKGKKVLGKQFGYAIENRKKQWAISEVEVVSTAHHFYLFYYGRLETDRTAKQVFSVIQKSLILNEK